MTRPLIPSILVSLLLVSLNANAQHANVVRVCVVARDTAPATMFTHPLNSTPQARYQRDQVVKYLRQHKSPANAPVALEAVALNSSSMKTLIGDANAASCAYVVTIGFTGLTKDDFDNRNIASGTDFIAGAGSGFPTLAPLSLSILRREPAGWWNGLPDGSYAPYQWFAKSIADTVSAVVVKHP